MAQGVEKEAGSLGGACTLADGEMTETASSVAFESETPCNQPRDLMIWSG